VARLPVPGADSGTWGDVLNEYLSQALNVNGSLKDNVVTSDAIAPGAVTATEIAQDTITATQIANGTITEAQLDIATQNKLNTAGSGSVADGTITTAKLHDDAVTADKIDDGAIVDVHVDAAAAISQGKIANLTTDLAGKAATVHTHTASQVSDSTATGRSVLTAVDAAAARTAIGAGTSSLVLGTSSNTAKAGDYAPAWGDVTGKPATFAPTDVGVLGLIQDIDSDTRTALDVLYTVPPEVQTGPAPVATVHADAGTDAGVASGGTRIALRATITTGTAPVSGGTLATFALSGYTLAPVVSVNPRDEISLATFPFASTSTTILTLKAAGELEPYTAYTYDIIILGL